MMPISSDAQSGHHMELGYQMELRHHIELWHRMNLGHHMELGVLGVCVCASLHPRRDGGAWPIDKVGSCSKSLPERCLRPLLLLHETADSGLHTPGKGTFALQIFVVLLSRLRQSLIDLRQRRPAEQQNKRQCTSDNTVSVARALDLGTCFRTRARSDLAHFSTGDNR